MVSGAGNPTTERGKTSRREGQCLDFLETAAVSNAVKGLREFFARLSSEAHRQDLEDSIPHTNQFTFHYELQRQRRFMPCLSTRRVTWRW